MKLKNFAIFFIFFVIILLVACTKFENKIEDDSTAESEISKYCRTAFEQTKECPDDKCYIACGGNGLNAGCAPACYPKPCHFFDTENCPLEICRIMINCKGEKVCSSKSFGNPPRCGEKGYFGQDVPCCEG